jgi:UDP-glucose 4-epimerase
MNSTIFITGSAGLVGSVLARTLRERGHRVVSFDLRDPDPLARGDVRDAAAVARVMRGCTGIIHLAAVSRVIFGERDPALCRSTNIGGTRTVLEAASVAPDRPWLIFASSREVYGQPTCLPATEDAVLAPINVYGHTKVAGEGLVLEARGLGVRGAVVRLSNVYGSTSDYADRVVPAFVRAAVRSAPLRVEGTDHTFDFTHVEDAACGIVALADLLRAGEPPPPPIHLLTGTSTSLGELAGLACDLAGTRAAIVEAPPRNFDVARFHGSPERARTLLGWSSQIPLRQGLARFVEAVRAEEGGPR